MHYGTLRHSEWLPVSRLNRQRVCTDLSVSLFLITPLLLSNGVKCHQDETLSIQLLPHFIKATGQRTMNRRREATCIEAKTNSKNTLLMGRSKQMNINRSSAS